MASDDDHAVVQLRMRLEKQRQSQCTLTGLVFFDTRIKLSDDRYVFVWGSHFQSIPEFAEQLGNRHFNPGAAFDPALMPTIDLSRYPIATAVSMIEHQMQLT